ncbi:MAG: LLM class flavin-dependent oxidoreductase [Deltaproteobacteria bacterium]
MSSCPAFSIRFDLRCPPFAKSSSADLAEAALAQSVWAEEQGFLAVILSEHHGSPDGYLPSPMVMAGAVAARTTRIGISLAAMIAPLHDPLRLAEDIAMIDVLSRGRVIPILAAGYVETEFHAFGKTLRDRGPVMDEICQFLDQAWRGESFEYHGKMVRVTPRPVQQPRPPILMGGSTRIAARRAAKWADYFVPSTDACFEMYREELQKLGKPDPGPPAPSLPMFVHISEDPDAAWEQIAPHALHESNAYGHWMAEAGLDGPYAEFADEDALRRSGKYLVVTPEEMIELCRGLGAGGNVAMHPLMGGLDPEIGWQSLRLLETKVLPILRAEAD